MTKKINVSKLVSLESLDDIVSLEETKSMLDNVINLNKEFSVEKVMDVLPDLIQFADKCKKLGGVNKKELVIKLLNIIIDKTDTPGDDEILDPIMKRMVPNIIDTLIKVDKKQLKLRKIKCLSCFK